MNNKITRIRRKLMEELDKDRYHHTLGVMYTSATLAMCHGANVEDAMYAGLLHDCAKCIPERTKLKLCEKYHLSVSDVEREISVSYTLNLAPFWLRKNIISRIRIYSMPFQVIRQVVQECPCWKKSYISLIIWNQAGASFPIWKK